MPIVAAMNNSLGIAKPPARTRVVVAMSGGVDSSAVAALLHAEGYDVVGVTLQLYDHGALSGRKGACCAGQDIYDARRVAERLAIPHYVLDYESRFKSEVMEAFATDYLAGETPIPCVRCNERVKFRDLLALARALGAEALATGHYVRRVDGPDGPELHRAADPARDQSYFLFATTRDQLAYLRFPLGERLKSETRALAERFGLPVAAKPDSQDICFVPQGSYAGVVERLRPGAAEPGEIVDLTGRVLGRHAGIIHFTVGQRRGLNVGGGGEPLFVVRLDAGERRVVVGPRAALARDRVTLRELNWLAAEPLGPEGRRVAVKLRSAQAPLPAALVPLPAGRAEVRLDLPHEGIAPGQAAVLYDGTQVLGGGWIAAAARSCEAA
ncbi:MAG: tRNA 2-thiouridine(34) synthase MnmA [Alphaproteobacteria bacterium]